MASSACHRKSELEEARLPVSCPTSGITVRSCGAVIESMTGARFVHDTLEQLGWEVVIADAQKVKGLAPLACKTDKIDERPAREYSPCPQVRPQANRQGESSLHCETASLRSSRHRHLPSKFP